MLAAIATVVGLAAARALSAPHTRGLGRPVSLPGGIRAQVADVVLQNPALGSVTSVRPGTALVTVRVAFTNLGGPIQEVGPYSLLDLHVTPAGPAVPQDPGFVGSTDPLTGDGGAVSPDHTMMLWRSFAVPQWALGRLALRVTPDLRAGNAVTLATRLPVPHPA